MKLLILVLTVFILFTSCLTPKSEPVPEEEIIQEVIPETKPEPIPTPKPVEEEVYVATEEEYDKTFEEIEILIENLNRIISKGDYNTWRTYLSTTYIEKYEADDYLKKVSENPVLKDYGIKLKTLKDYFNYLVMPARSNVIIDEIQFITEDKIKAFTYKNGDKFVVYLLIKSENGWIISD